MLKQPTLSFQINRRLFVTILAAWLMITGLAAYGLWVSYRTDQDYSRSLREVEALQASALNLNTAIVSEMLNTRAFLISGEENAATSRRLARQDAEREFDMLKRLLYAEPSLKAPELAKLLALHGEYIAVGDRLIALRKSGQTVQAQQLFDAQSDPLVLSMQAASRDLQNEISQGIVEMNADYTQRTGRAIWLAAAVVIGCAALSGIAILLWVSPLLRGLNYLETVLINAAETQVYQPIAAWPGGSGRPPALLDAYNRLVQRLLEGNAAILKYVRYLHHEMNTLLASVIGYGYMLADPALRPQDASMEEYGKVIVDQTRRTINLVDDFTLAARIEGGQFAPALLPVSLGPLLSALVDDLAASPPGEERSPAAQREIRLLGCSSPVVVLGDALFLENALRKVIENALKFSPAEKPVEVTVETARSPLRVMIRVRDQGIGIAAEDLPVLFQPFSRIKNEAARHLSGSGMGLYLAAAILRAHHGTITAQSQPGAGSVFTITLPLREG